MLDSIFNMIGQSIYHSLAWFNQFDNVLHFTGVLFSAFLLYTVVRILIQPLIGQGQSDFVRIATNSDERRYLRNQEIIKKYKK